MKHLLILIGVFTCCHQKTTHHKNGLNYPLSVESRNNDFYIYQYKDSLTTLDSFQEAEFGRYFLKGFHEPDLSVHPQESETFRFIYEGLDPFIITLTQDRIIVKRKKNGWLYPYRNIEKLGKYEQEQVAITEWYFRMSEAKKKDSFQRRHIDSLLQIYPHMKDIEYYQNTLNRIAEYQPFQYSINTILITKNTFDSLVSLINESGFWNMPRVSDCNNIPADTDRFSLEANTADQYKVVRSLSCPNDNRKFTKACQTLVEAAGLSKEINLLWNGKTIPVPDADIPAMKLEQELNQ